MTFDDDAFRQFVRALQGRLDWQEELRRLLLSQELLAVPERLARVEAALDRLAARVEQLSEAQARTQEQLSSLVVRVDRLAEAQARTQQQLSSLVVRVDRLAEAQARTEEQLSTLAVRVGQLAEALERLTGRVDRLGREVGALSEGVGAGAELEGERALARLLPDKGYHLLERLRPLAMNGEVDVVTRVRDADGQTFSVMLEAKFRLHRGDVAGWHRRLRDRAVLGRLRLRGIEPPFLVYAFGLRVYEDAEEAGRETGIGILTPAGEIVPAAPLSPATGGGPSGEVKD